MPAFAVPVMLANGEYSEESDVPTNENGAPMVAAESPRSIQNHYSHS